MTMVSFPSLRPIRGRLIDILHLGLEHVERWYLQQFDVPKYPSLFILGLPRSGTTLIYQYLVHRLDVAYFCNGVDRYPRAPCLTTLLRKMVAGKYSSDFRNNYGHAPGIAAPHEAGNVWGRFFGFHDYKSSEYLSTKDQKTLQRMIAGVEVIFGGCPFVNKNVKHLLRLDALADALPDAVFLVVQRSLQDVALSLLRGRYANLGTAERFWSARPPNADELADLPPHEQIPRQLLSLTERLHTDLDALEDGRVLIVDYKSFCESPEELVSRVSAVLGLQSTCNRSLNQFLISENLPETSEEERLVASLDELLSDMSINFRS